MESKPVDIKTSRIWVDGCFDFAHHGHAGAMLQARQLGKELYVGVHSDEEILLNKGPVVMRLDERMTAVDACKWSTKAIPGAPYVTDPKVMEEYGCKYVVHGDDITTDANGNDCYQVVKDLGKFVVVKRTPNISTTDLVGRMLVGEKKHHYRLLDSIKGHDLFSEDNLAKYKAYATDESGLKPGSSIFVSIPLENQLTELVGSSKNYERISYIDGGFDLFHPGHIEALKIAKEKATRENSSLVIGVHDDKVINQIKGLNHPIMNIFERSLCILQCKYVDGIILGAPYQPTKKFLKELPGEVISVLHGPTPLEEDAYKYLEDTKLCQDIGPHKYDDISTAFIVQRILDNRQAYEDRQRRKGWKKQREELLQQQESS